MESSPPLHATYIFTILIHTSEDMTIFYMLMSVIITANVKLI